MDGMANHVINRAAGRMKILRKEADYLGFERVLDETWERTEVRILSYSVMPKHWRLLLWPREDGELSEVMRWLTVTHTQCRHAHYHTSGSGPVYPGAFSISLPDPRRKKRGRRPP